MAEITRSSRLFVVEEVTEGVGVSPTAANQAVVLQEGFELTGEFEKLENAELKGSIGKAKPVLGLETSQFSFSHYLTHSGVEGQAPEYNLFLKSLIGSETAQATERTTTVGSTAGTSLLRATVVLAAGGSDYSKGKAALIKDGTNGYSIRNIYSVATNTLTLAQNLAVAPATGVTLGKFINYSPSDSGHPSLSCWLYRSNGGDVELARGVKIEEGTIEFASGEFINMSISGSGTGYDFDPIEITSSTRYIDFEVDSGTYAAILDLGIYKDPIELAQQVQDKMDALVGVGEAITCVWNSSGANIGKFTITATGSVVFEIAWATGANTANTAASKLGYTVADDTGALFYHSDSQLVWSSPYTPSYDNSQPLVAKNIEVLVGEFDDLVCFEAQSFSLSVANTKQNIPSACAESGISGSLHSGREVTGNLVATLTKHDADKFYRFRSGAETMITVNAGTKTGGNWDAGKCVNCWVSRCTLDTHTVGDSDGIVTISLDFSGYVENSEGEVFVNFL
jgi:hypothetical protein